MGNELQTEMWIAAYGAIVATISLGWQIWAAITDRPDLRVSASAPSKVLSPKMHGQPGLVTFGISYPVAVMNAGKKPITIISADYRFTLEPLIQADRGVVYDGDPVLSLSPELFPIKLDAGDAQTITLGFLLEASADQGFQRGYKGVFTFEFETTRGTLSRTADFTLGAHILNQRLPS